MAATMINSCLSVLITFKINTEVDPYLQIFLKHFESIKSDLIYIWLMRYYYRIHFLMQFDH